MKTIRWLFWSAYYGIFGYPKTLDAYINATMKTWNPWRRFKPSLYHNDDLREWQVWFEDDLPYCCRETMSLEVFRSDRTGRIVGLKVWDELLAPKKPE